MRLSRLWFAGPALVVAGISMSIAAVSFWPAPVRAADEPKPKAKDVEKPAPADKPDAAEKPDAGGGGSDALDKKGLKKSGAVYVVDDEAKLIQSMKNLSEAKKKLASDAKDRQKIEKNINFIKSRLGNGEFEIRKLNEKIASSPDAASQNRIIGQINSLTLQMREGLAKKEELETELRKMGDAARSDYIGVVMDLEKKVVKVEKKYEELKDDEDVKTALEAATPKGKLGPSPAFASASQQIKKLRADINAETIKLTMENNTPWVDVTLNGSIVRQMVLDTGASIIAIPYDMAKAMELVAPKDAPIMRLQLADGKVVEAKGITLKSVRVGAFEVKDVEGAILPETLVAAQPLLGGSFLSNFIFKIDTAKGELYLAKIGSAATGAPGDKAKPGDKADPKGDKEMPKDKKAAKADE